MPEGCILGLACSLVPHFLGFAADWYRRTQFTCHVFPCLPHDHSHAVGNKEVAKVGLVEFVDVLRELSL